MGRACVQKSLANRYHHQKHSSLHLSSLLRLPNPRIHPTVSSRPSKPRRRWRCVVCSAVTSSMGLVVLPDGKQLATTYASATPASLGSRPLISPAVILSFPILILAACALTSLVLDLAFLSCKPDVVSYPGKDNMLSVHASTRREGARTRIH